MLNRSILIGRPTREPELRYTPSGVAVATFTLAVDRPKHRDKEQETDFIPIVVWRQSAENCANHLKKGKMCAVEGRIQVRNYDNNEGRKVYVTEIHADNVKFLEWGDKGQQQAPDTQNNDDKRSFGGTDTFANDGKPIDISDDDLPF